MDAAEFRADGDGDSAERDDVASRDCSAFLENHAAYMDDVMSADEASAHEGHADACRSCARYAHVLDRGLTLARELPEIEPSAYFEERLRHRIFHIEDEARLERSTGRSTVGLAAAALIALIAWSPVLWRSNTLRSASGASYATSAGSTATASSRYLYGDANDIAALRERDGRHPNWFVHTAASVIDQTPVRRFVSFAGSYSPLIVSPPAARGPRAVRLVSAITQ